MVAMFWVARKPEQECGCGLKSPRLIRALIPHPHRLDERHPLDFDTHELSKRVRGAFGIRRQSGAKPGQWLGDGLHADVRRGSSNRA